MTTKQTESKAVKKNSIDTKGGGDPATEFLKKQHRELETLFDQTSESSSGDLKNRENLLTQLAEKLTIHTRLEEKLFYPAVRKDADELILRFFEEHDNIDAMLHRFLQTKANDETFKAKIQVLKNLFYQHLKEEEEVLFPMCEKMLGEEKLGRLANELVAMRDDEEKQIFPDLAGAIEMIGAKLKARISQSFS